ncbi:MAG: ABC transporter permease [Gemmatimonadota bacterium]
MAKNRTERGRLFRDEPRSEVQDELDFHVEQRVREYVARGMDEESARRAALERIGDIDRVRGECTELLAAERRALARRDWVSDLRQDLRFSLRAAGRTPLFTIMAVLTLALGIGANSAVFGVVKSVLLDALPYGEPTELVRVQSRFETTDHDVGALSAGTIQDVLERQRSFASMAASISGGPDAVLQQDDNATTVRLAWVQPEFFRTLGVSPALGRTFDDAEAASDTSHVIVVTHELWRQRFNADPAILGRRITLNGLPRTVKGVLPEDYVHPVGRGEVFMPFSLQPLLANPVNARGSHFLEMVARLKPGVAVEAGNADVARIGSELAVEYPFDNRGISLEAVSLHETMMGDTRTPLLVLMGSAGIVLLVACANLAAALLSRMIARRREFAVRISLGAARGRLVRQLLAESVLLAVVGGAAGLLLAGTGLAVLRGANLDAIPDYANLTLDAGAVAFTMLLALLTGIAFGLIPALAAGREEPQAVLRDESRSVSDSRGAGRLRGLLVAGQVAFCLSLLAGAGLLARSLWLMSSSPLGFDSADVLTFTVPLAGPRYQTLESHLQFRTDMMERLGALPGVTAVAMTSFVPTRVDNSNGVVVVGVEKPDEAVPFVLTSNVTESYFETLRIPIVAGRAFATSDNLASTPVAMVSEAMARQFWPGGDAVGARIRVGPDPDANPIEVIGIVRDVRTDIAQTQPQPMLYTPLRQGWWGSTFMVRTATEPQGYIAMARETLAGYDSALPMADVATLREVIGEGLAPRRLPMLLMLSFGALALLLACIGIYALFANMAVARQHEFGVRMALGSRRSDIATLVLRDGARWMAVGLAGGAVGVFVVSRALRGLVYGIAPLDVVSIAAAVATLVIAAAIALAVPVHRATRADPLSVMR